MVDDEKNIRLTVTQSLEKLDLETDASVSGEEALEKIKNNGYDLVLLDLKLPGIDGMEVLRKVRSFNKKIKILIITAHGTVENAVEAMKLGAVDFIQKPFTPDEIRQFVSKALLRKKGFLQEIKFDQEEKIEKIVDKILEGKSEKEAEAEPIVSEEEAEGEPVEIEEKDAYYENCIQQAKAAIELSNYNLAEPWVRKAISIDTSRAEAFNFLGVLFELKNDKLTARKYYRAALALKPSYKPAWHNLDRSTRFNAEGKYDLGVKTDIEGKKGIRAFFSKKSNIQD